MSNDISPLDLARAITPWWMLRIKDFDALEIHACAIIGRESTGKEIVEPCEPADADFWTVYGHYRTGGVDAFEDFATETEAAAFHDRLLSIYPHLAAWED